MKRFLLAVFAVLVLSSGPSHAEGLAPVKLGINKLGAMTNVWVAEKTGIFKKHGLDLQVIEIPLTDQSIPLLQSKSVDIVQEFAAQFIVIFNRRQNELNLVNIKHAVVLQRPSWREKGACKPAVQQSR